MRVLFFTPFAARNGAEMMLLYVIKNLDTKLFTCALHSGYNGALISELPKDVQSFTFSPPVETEVTLQHRIFRKLKSKISKKNVDADKNIIKTPADFIISVHNEFKPDIWYINTVLCTDAVSLAVDLKIPFVVHFHDLLFLYQSVTYNNLKSAILNANLLVGCSQGVCDKLNIMGGKNIALQYVCVDIDKIKVSSDNVNRIREKLKIGKSFVWIMSGSIEYRKGTDLIPSIARALGESVTILWLGPGESGYSYYVEQELKYYEINNVHMLGSKSEDYFDYLALADGLVLTSREDPFPLVMIEAAALGLPIAAFNSGGVSEFVKEGMGIVVESHDVSDLVKAMKKIADNRIGFSKEVAIARANEFNAKKQVRNWQEMMLSNFPQ